MSSASLGSKCADLSENEDRSVRYGVLAETVSFVIFRKILMKEDLHG